MWQGRSRHSIRASAREDLTPPVEFFVALKVIGTVVVHEGSGDEVVRVTEPVPVADDVVVFVSLTLKSARTGGEPVLVTWNEAGLTDGPGELRVPPSMTPHAGPAVWNSK